MFFSSRSMRRFSYINSFLWFHIIYACVHFPKITCCAPSAGWIAFTCSRLPKSRAGTSIFCPCRGRSPRPMTYILSLNTVLLLPSAGRQTVQVVSAHVVVCVIPFYPAFLGCSLDHVIRHKCGADKMVTRLPGRISRSINLEAIGNREPTAMFNRDCRIQVGSFAATPYHQPGLWLPAWRPFLSLSLALGGGTI
jgi:hypothetical protein